MRTTVPHRSYRLVTTQKDMEAMLATSEKNDTNFTVRTTVPPSSPAEDLDREPRQVSPRVPLQTLPCCSRVLQNGRLPSQRVAVLFISSV